jgi:asparagine synthetase B (glutamine-hydrolysing)
MHELRETPFCDTHGSYFDESGQLASAPNRLANSNSQIDESAIACVLQFGAILPPLSPWKGIGRFKPGYEYRGTELIGPVKLEQPTEVKNFNSEQQADEVERILDDILRSSLQQREDPVLLFSGGVDSGFIASRLAALGYRDSLLLNYSFRDDDPESLHAEAMARKLGLRFERISTQRNLSDCLQEPGCVYPQPFADHSTVPTSDLAHAVVERLDGERRLILDGTGADGAFGMTFKIEKWNRIMRVPAPLRRAAAIAYGMGFWHRTGSLERRFRILRRSINMPLLSAVLAQNPLDGILYRTPSRDHVHALLADWVEPWVEGSMAQSIVAGDLAMICANIFAQKGLPILNKAGFEVEYPFLKNAFVSTSMASIPFWNMAERKAPLKESLARHVPREMVYRKKSGFVDIAVPVFFDSTFIEHLRAAAEASGPISALLEPAPLLSACEYLSRGHPLPLQTLNCLWAITFMDRWYRTAQFG